MLRYAELLRVCLTESGHEVELVRPRPVLSRFSRVGGISVGGSSKWVAYLDKYLLGTPRLRLGSRRFDILHIADHSNAVYAPGSSRVPCVVTCHDLLAVRGGLGEDTDCPASATGAYLQRAILRGLRRTQAVACVSKATLRDATHLLGGFVDCITTVPLALNFPYRPLEHALIAQRLSAVPQLAGRRYLLNIGSNQRRKNREAALRTLAALNGHWDGVMVFAGQGLSPQLRQQAAQFGVMSRLVEVEKPDNELLEALYGGAHALLMPSRFEGFGWPIIEAQACACPVLCSDRPPFPDVSGDAAILCDADDQAAFADAVLRLEREPALRADLVTRGQSNAARYARSQMAAGFTRLYQQLLPESDRAAVSAPPIA